MQSKSTTPRPGQFKKGADPRRHTFTREECQRGFWAAIDSFVVRYPHPAPAYKAGACYTVCSILLFL
jgi:hypothetical protein